MTKLFLNYHRYLFVSEAIEMYPGTLNGFCSRKQVSRFVIKVAVGNLVEGCEI